MPIVQCWSDKKKHSYSKNMKFAKKVLTDLINQILTPNITRHVMTGYKFENLNRCPSCCGVRIMFGEYSFHNCLDEWELIDKRLKQQMVDGFDGSKNLYLHVSPIDSRRCEKINKVSFAET